MRALLAALLVLAAPASAAPPEPTPEAMAQKARGDQRRRAGDLEGAALAYRAAVEHQPGWARAHAALGEALYGLRRYAEAAEELGAAVELDPEDALSWSNLASASRMAAAPARARTAYERYLLLRPGDADGHLGYAEVLRAAGERDAALREYRTFVRLAKDDPAQAGAIEQAMAKAAELEAQGAIEAPPHAATPIPTPIPTPTSTPTSPPTSTPTSSPTSAPTSAPTPASTPTSTSTSTPSAAAPPSLSQAVIEKLGAGDRASLAGDHRAALFAYQDAVHLDPGNPVPLVRLARAYAALRHPEEAEAQLRLALQLDPGNAEARHALDELRNPAPPRPVPPAPQAPAAPKVYRLTPESDPRPVVTP